MNKPVKIAMLLDGPVRYDARVTRIAKTLSRYHEVHLYYIHPTEADEKLFKDSGIKLCPVKPGKSYYNKLNHFLFIHKKFEFFYAHIISTGEDYQVIHANDYPCLDVAGKIAEKLGAALVYDAHEIYLETINQFYPADAVWYRRLVFELFINLSRRIGYNIEKIRLDQCKVFITTSPSFAQYFKERYAIQDAYIVMNCPELKTVKSENLLRLKYGFKDTDKIILYQGLLNSGRGLEELVLSFVHLPEQYKLVILGYGMLEENLKKTVIKHQLEGRVFFHERVDHQELLRYTASADIGVLILDPVNISKKLASANKIFEYMAAGIPVFATDLPENKSIIESCDSGYLIKHKAPAYIAEQLIVAFEDEYFPAKGENGKKCFHQKYNWEAQSLQLEKAYKQVIGW